MSDVDLRSPNGPAQRAAGSPSGGFDEGDVGGSGSYAPSYSPPSTRPYTPRYTSRASTAPAEADSEFTSVEVAGEAAGGESAPAGQEGANEEVSANGEAAVESATEAQLAAEAGEESAVSDLRGIEGFTESTGSESAEAAAAAEAGLAEVGSAVGGETAEFLPFLAALVPTLISTVGPLIAKGIQGGLSTRAKAVINRIPIPAPAPGPARVQPGSQGALLAQIAQLLRTLARPGGESVTETTAESQAFVTEAIAVLETIIGTDDRVRIQNTNQIPWRRICALRITFSTGAVYRGTGFLIGPRAVATAGHCVYLHNQGGWARKIEVIPGSNGPTKPYGSVESSQLRSVGGWVNSRRPESDYGCVVLEQGAFGGHNLGSFGVGALSPQDLVAKPAVLAGYPGDKPFAELWGMARKIKTVGPLTLGYDIDTVGGQSGAPVYIKRNGSRTVVGIHNYGSSSGNSATRVTQQVAQRLIAWSRL